MAETPEQDEFQRIVDGLNEVPTSEQVLRVWAAQHAAAIMRGRASAFGALPSMDAGSVVVLADWIITGEVSVMEDEVDEVDPN
jgi:hypothetical protein